MNKKRLFLWCLYDFANSIIFITFLLYFAQWIVIGGGLSDFWYNGLFAIATILLFLTAPVLAAYTDKHGGRKYFLNISTIGTFICYGLAALLATIGAGTVIWAAVFFLLGQYFYQLSFVFYHPMLGEVADSSNRARASGIGQFSNALGQVFGVLIMLPLAGVRTAPLLPAVGIFFVLALPMMIFFNESRERERGIHLKTIKAETVVFWKKLMSFFMVSAAAPMLVAFFFFNDALLTVSNNYSIYIERVFSVSDVKKSIVLLVVLIMSAVGGIIAGWLGEKIGLLKTIKVILVGWMIALPLMAIAPNFAFFTVTAVLSGLLIGSMWATTRAYMLSILPHDQLNYGFSFYTLLERFSTLVGPLTWGGIIGILGVHSFAYRIAVGVMTVFVVIGFLILQFWKRNHVQKEAL